MLLVADMDCLVIDRLAAFPAGLAAGQRQALADGRYPTYQLLIRLPAAAAVEVGKLGRFHFAAGCYCYTGSARRGMAARLARHLTLEQLSDLAGVSKAMLSQIEQNKVNPTVAVMLKIAAALQVSMDELIDVPTRSNIIRIIPASEERYTFLAEPDCTIRTLSPLNLEKNIEFYRITLEQGAEHSSEPHYPGTEEFLYVNRGRVRVTTGQQEADLSRGDHAAALASYEQALAALRALRKDDPGNEPCPRTPGT